VLQHIHSLRLFYRFDGGHFATNFEFSVADKIKRGKPPRRNRDIDYCDYCTWAHAMLVRFSTLKLQLWIVPHFLGLEILTRLIRTLVIPFLADPHYFSNGWHWQREPSSCSSSRPSSSSILCCLKYEPLSLAASASAHWGFPFRCLLRTWKRTRSFAFLFCRHLHYKQRDAWQTNRAMPSKICCASITWLLCSINVYSFQLEIIYS